MNEIKNIQRGRASIAHYSMTRSIERIDKLDSNLMPDLLIKEEVVNPTKAKRTKKKNNSLNISKLKNESVNNDKCSIQSSRTTIHEEQEIYERQEKETQLQKDRHIEHLQSEIYRLKNIWGPEIQNEHPSIIYNLKEKLTEMENELIEKKKFLKKFETGSLQIKSQIDKKAKHVMTQRYLSSVENEKELAIKLARSKCIERDTANKLKSTIESNRNTELELNKKYIENAESFQNKISILQEESKCDKKQLSEFKHALTIKETSKLNVETQVDSIIPSKSAIKSKYNQTINLELNAMMIAFDAIKAEKESIYQENTQLQTEILKLKNEYKISIEEKVMQITGFDLANMNCKIREEELVNIDFIIILTIRMMRLKMLEKEQK